MNFVIIEVDINTDINGKVVSLLPLSGLEDRDKIIEEKLNLKTYINSLN